MEEKKHLFIIDPTDYKGNIVNTMYVFKDGTEVVSYRKPAMNFAEYKKEKGNENLIAIEEEEYYEKFQEPFLKSLQGDWKEISKERYWDLLECLPPMRWTQGVISFFFMSEADMAYLHACIIKDARDKDNVKYYSALRSIFEKAEDIVNNYINQK
jgi:hypothetical protein